MDESAGGLLCTPPDILDGENCAVLGEPGLLLVKPVELAGGSEGEVVGGAAPFGVVDIVEAGGGGLTIVVDSTALETDEDMLPVSENTISGA